MTIDPASITQNDVVVISEVLESTNITSLTSSDVSSIYFSV